MNAYRAPSAKNQHRMPLSTRAGWRILQAPFLKLLSAHSLHIICRYPLPSLPSLTFIYPFTMAWRATVGTVFRSIRFTFNEASSSAWGVAGFLEGNFSHLKAHNPNLPVRSACSIAGLQFVFFSRFSSVEPVRFPFCALPHSTHAGDCSPCG